MGAGGPEGSGRALRLDPFALPVRFSTQDGGADGQIRHIEVDRERVVVRRAVRGIAMKVGRPVSDFLGVSLRLMPAAGTSAATIAVTLDHRDSALSVPLFAATDTNDGLAIWKSWGRVLGLPLLVIDSDGAMREPFPRLGSLTVASPLPRRRRRAAIKWRRPRILLRRKPGCMSETPTVHRGEREIIARN
jgi:Family of unknown function (DUF6101)